jgi:hypothetical protein
MTILLIIMAAFFLMYFAFAQSGANTLSYAHQQGEVRSVVRILEADLRSADPLTTVPASFTSAVTLPAGTVTSGGTTGTSPTDVIAMYTTDDRYSPCAAGTTTTTAVPSPFLSSPFSANVVWAYNSAAQTLTRYSYVTPNSSASTTICKNGGWIADGVVLDDVTNAHGTMFTISQSTSLADPQATVPTSTTVPNQAAPACGAAVSILISVQNKSVGEQLAFSERTSLPLPNQIAVQGQAC